MVKKVSSIIFYIIAILFLGVYGLAEITKHLYLSEFGRLSLLCGSCVFLYFGGLILSKYRKDNKPMKINLWIFFGLYLLLFITLTLFDQFWGRNGLTIVNWSKEMFEVYIHNSLNIIPFKTIIEYIGAFDSLLDTRAVMFNLLGNIVACMPFAFFLPLLFKKQNNLKRFALTMIIIVLGIELLQFATLSGSCDIDDIILNVSGAIIMYAILKIKSVNNLIKNIFLLEKNKVEKKSIIMIIICIVIILALGVVLVKSRQNVFDNNYNELMSKYNFTLEIIDESEVTAQALEKFYEDEYHTYYFSSIKSDYVYAVINGNEKYLVKDLLNNNPTEYKITISKLEDAGLKFITENKYEDIILKGKGNLSPKISIEDTSIMEIGYGKSNSMIDGDNPENSNYEMQFFIVPLKSGNTEFEIKLLNNENNEVVSVEKYIVNVNDELKVNYEKVSNNSKEIEWNEITEAGVNEELLLKNIDMNILQEVATNLQSIIEEEAKEEKENPELVLSDGWIRIFDKEGYQKVISIGDVAIKPLYYILYKSPNNGQYEYLCAKALQTISGITFGEENGLQGWSTAKEYLDLFTKEIIKRK